jgi:heme oxygenase
MTTETLERSTAATLEQSEGKPLSQVLKEATEKIHHEVEHGASLTRGVVARVHSDDAGGPDGRAYLDNYKLFLRAAYGYEKATLDRVREFAKHHDLSGSAYPAEIGDPCEAIRNDLLFLEESRELAAMPGLPNAESLAEIAGIEYVRRGSRNGNAYIAHVVNQNLGFGSENGAAFLNMDAGQTRPRWEAVKTWLDALVLSPVEIQKAVDSAIVAFRAVGAWHRKLSGNH